ncbi:unnamed protein product [Peronospora destructor]|uniref:N-acetyltransferase domain-containing protein n=1 Tax=Peronospora destructor TaxID=86335 RepID=A0AAV0UB38_9STRA|nr:unnamed protein product [Peronospora destructor]
MSLVVTPVTTSDEMQQAMALRRKKDPHDNEPSTIHFVGKDSETIFAQYVAVARCLLDELNRKAKFGHVAVLAECRGKNFGAQLMDAIEKHVRDHVDMFALSSQYGRKGFYEKCGYSCISDETYLEEGIEHCYMVKPATETD